MAVLAAVGMARRSMFWGYEVAHGWQLSVVALFVGYYIFALRQYGRWLRASFADLEHKRVWQSLVAVLAMLAVYVVYTSNAGELPREYLSQVISVVPVARRANTEKVVSYVIYLEGDIPE